MFSCSSDLKDPGMEVELIHETILEHYPRFVWNNTWSTKLFFLPCHITFTKLISRRGQIAEAMAMSNKSEWENLILSWLAWGGKTVKIERTKTPAKVSSLTKLKHSTIDSGYSTFIFRLALFLWLRVSWRMLVYYSCRLHLKVASSFCCSAPEQ